ncbi:MAG: hypothetical protein A2846_05250 [Candidatus Doudnabacteria bacterium RIFCSPHIGHO2_01_FULL_49_9]|uniref:Uncharacterized protein n=1 Tax=Candidatus Doudnabacteria bacterium RIFCSPHIGHO2_01_FULL_49_9 TaxID=1817827 RepID=A0A1F5P0R9_9BACT|nr:MAG: hypothetical protein A2846_05250 [Candidatus Doudnabacteria bacterium RIFCSPHIGHO2_01_FULL_49_9]
MIDYKSITLKAINNKLMTADPRLRELMNSNELTEKIHWISSDYNFDADDNENLAFHKLVGATLLGFIKPDELPEAITTFIATSQENALAATNEVKRDILPLAGTQTAPIVQPITNTTTQPPTRPAPLPVPPRPASQTPAAASAPFVLHETKEVKSDIQTDIDTRGTTRPVFYKPAFAPPKPGTNYAQLAPAKVDIGGAPVTAQPVPATPPADRTVNYTMPAQTPFGTVKTNPVAAPSTSVNSENIIDLKDLPR